MKQKEAHKHSKHLKQVNNRKSETIFTWNGLFDFSMTVLFLLTGFWLILHPNYYNLSHRFTQQWFHFTPHISLYSLKVQSKQKVLPVKSRRGSCWAERSVPLRLGESDGAQISCWQTARAWETQLLRVSPARVACWLYRLILHRNPCSNPIDGPPLLYQLRQSAWQQGPLLGGGSDRLCLCFESFFSPIV